MAFRTLSFDTRAAIPTDGFPATVAYVSSAAHKIHNVYVTKENASDLTLDMTLDQLKTDIFGDSLTFALLADKPMTFGNPSSSGTDISSWKSWYRPANSVTGTGTTKPSYLINGTGQAARPTMLFDEGEIASLPSAQFQFASTDPFTIFVSFKAVTKNSAREAYLFGGTNPSRGDLLSIWGIDNNKCAIIDNANNEALWSGSLMTGDNTSGTVWDYENGIELLEDTSTFTSAFNFNFINKANTTDGDQGSGTFEINEILVYDEDASTMGTTKRQEIEGYLAHKWETNSALRNANGSTGHPYVTTDPRDSKGTHTVRKFSSPMSTIVSGFSEASVPALTEVGASVFTKEAWASPGLSVAADQVVQFVVEDMNEPGIVYIKIDYT
ncbi:MAG: hypothetical protein CXT65_05145 [Methanobacteriota archaeon]|nr:MAG: hypothetical protein CXT65_05145 [Euryarchaeota archaeon]